ncbi:hypothetical protein SprV_0200947700 [Sparganum proliferum]
MVFAALQLQEKCQEIRRYDITFVNLTVAFGVVNRDELSKIMQKLGSPERSTHMVRQLHAGMMARASRTRDSLKDIRGGQRNLMLSALLMVASRNERPAIRVAHRTEGRLLNSRRMKGPSRIPTTVYDLNLADDCALNTATEVDV